MDFAGWNMTCENFVSWNCPFRKLNFDFASWICDFATCKIVFQLGVVVFQWPELLHLSSDLHTIWSVGLLTSLDSKRYIVCIKWTPGAQNVSCSCSPLEFLHVRFLSLFFLLAFLIWLWHRVTKLQILVSSWIWASNWFAMNYTKISLILGLLWW